MKFHVHIAVLGVPTALAGPAAFTQTISPALTASALAVGDAAPMFKVLAVRAAKRT